PIATYIGRRRRGLERGGRCCLAPAARPPLLSRGPMPAYAIGIDIGGTFTDCFVTDGTRGWRGKAPTTPRALVDGLLAALDAAAADAGVPLARLLAGAVHLGL